jgi:hypothetical protein
MPLQFLADEDFRRCILRALRRHHPGMDVLRVQDVGLAGAHDLTILEWAAREGRVLLTHDVSTMPVYAYERIGQGLPMPGVFVISQALPLGLVIEEVVLLAECSREGEWEGRVLYLPL